MTSQLIQVWNRGAAGSSERFTILLPNGAEVFMQFHERKFSTVQNIGEFLFRGVHISQHAKDSYHGAMAMDVFEIRKNNLSTLLTQRGKAAEIAGKVDSTPSYLSTIKGGSRRMGDEMARRIEEAEGLEHGWMDRIHLAAGEDASGDLLITAKSIEDLAEQLKMLKSEQVAELFYMVMHGSEKGE